MCLLYTENLTPTTHCLFTFPLAVDDFSQILETLCFEEGSAPGDKKCVDVTTFEDTQTEGPEIFFLLVVNLNDDPEFEVDQTRNTIRVTIFAGIKFHIKVIDLGMFCLLSILFAGIVVGFDVTTANVSEGEIWRACVKVFTINIPTSITVEVQATCKRGTAEGLLVQNSLLPIMSKLMVIVFISWKLEQT